MNYRDKLQEKWATDFLNLGGLGILHLCPRSGKIRTSISIFKKLKKNLGRDPKILICYPDKNIQRSWEEDIYDVDYNNSIDIEYSTHVSLEKKISKQKYDIIVCDEIHLLSTKQKRMFKSIMKQSSCILGLSGTLSEKTQEELEKELNLKVLMIYSLEEAINDGLISDYKITVIKTDLDNTTIIDQKKQRTEKQVYNAFTWVIENKGSSLFLNLGRMRVIHNSLSKTNKTKDVLTQLKNERVLVFCPNNKVAKALNCKVHTAIFNNQSDFEKFIKNTSKNKHIAVCKIGNTGVSFKQLSHIVINAFDSNSENLTQRICRSLILDEKDKVSNVYIITSNEKAELRWLEKSLEFFDKNKILYK